MLDTLPAELARLTPALRAVARELLADPEAVAHEPAGALARRAGTGIGTVFRLAEELGLPSFTALQWAVRREHNRTWTATTPTAPW
ncbi:MAG TPA: hypothetical protein VGC57_00680 [Cellulomonas sp.]